MSLKDIFGKVFSKKSSADEQAPTEAIRHEVSFGTTVIEPTPQLSTTRECGIEVYLKNEKTAFHKIVTDTRIGRDPSQCDLSIPELIISKLHCTIFFQGDDAYIKDNGSTNGTFVNGQQVTEKKLEDNDMITLGRKGTVRIIFYRRGEI